MAFRSRKKQLQALEEQVAALRAELATTDEQTAERLSAMETIIEGHDATLDITTKAIDDLPDASKVATVDQVKDLTHTQQEIVATTEAKLGEQREAIAAQQSALSKQLAALEQQKSMLAGQQQALAEQRASITSQGSTLTEQQAALSAMEQTLAGQQTLINGQEETIKALRLRLDELETKTAASTARVEARLGEITEQVLHQVEELGNEVDAATKMAQEALETTGIPDALIQELRDTQAKLANEQVRYDLALREELAELAERLRRSTPRGH